MKLPKEWSDFGARWGRDGLLYLNEWRRGFTVHELRAMWFRCQQVRTLELEVKRLTSELEAAQDALQHALERAAWYRDQLVLESRAGALLAWLSPGIGREGPTYRP